MNGEWHVTVEGSPILWHRLCTDLGIKPLWIELSNFERQLMCASKQDPREILLGPGVARQFKVVRIKHEVQPVTRTFDVSTYSDPAVYYTQLTPPPEHVCYYECHVKIDGPFIPNLPNASRDLFRDNRWYLTERSDKPFDPSWFLLHCRFILRHSTCNVVGGEYEACILDTNRGLDNRWMVTRVIA